METIIDFFYFVMNPLQRNFTQKRHGGAWAIPVFVAALIAGCQTLEVQEVARHIIPEPLEWTEGAGSCRVEGKWSWDLPEEWKSMEEEWTAWLGGTSDAEGVSLRVEKVETTAGEGYELIITSDGMVVRAGDEAGVFRGLTSLKWMMPPDGWEEHASWLLPELHVLDAPRFEHRGLLLDCCRHFMEPEFVKEMIDLLALHKMNILHWHLTEDQGWRIPIDAYPALTQVGAWRTEKDGSTHGGFYTKDQIRDIVAYAAERHITVIPEIELPGHSSAAIATYPWLGCTGDSIEVPNDWGVFSDIYCAGSDTTFRFLEAVLDEVMELFPSTFIHIGGDEAPKVRWENCPKCQQRIRSAGLHDEHELQSWFISQIGQYLEERGRKLIGWDEILEGGLPEGATVQSWRGMEGGRDAVLAGHDAIMSPTSHCYFDYPVESTDMEEVYGFEPMPADLHGTGRILGGECNMWTEHAPQSLVHSKVFPRLVAMSEALWSEPEQKDWEDFKIRMEIHYDRLNAWGVKYGWEAVPIALDWGAGESADELLVQLTPAVHGIQGTVQFVSARSSNKDSETRQLESPFSIQGEGVLEVQLQRHGVPMGEAWTFPVAGHLGVSFAQNFENVRYGHEWSQYYPGRGQQALADGRLGSSDFRDGSWQATQGEPMSVQIELAEPSFVDSLSMQCYRYQDAWIFLPDSVQFQWSMDGVEWKGEWLTSKDFQLPNTMIPTDAQDVVRLAASVSDMAKWVRFEARNPGVCPSWHDAASMETWLFLDELVVHGSPQQP